MSVKDASASELESVEAYKYLVYYVRLQQKHLQ